MHDAGEEKDAAVLFVSNNRLLLNSVGRIFTGSDIRIMRAVTAESALNIITDNRIAVMVLDGYHCIKNEIDLLSKLADVSPDTLRILIADDANLIYAFESARRKEVSRVIKKPYTHLDLFQNVKEVVIQYYINESLKRENKETLLSIAQAVELKDPYTLGHCARVKVYALMLAHVCGIPLLLKNDIHYGSLLHDFGKIQTPEHILNKSGPLTMEEFSVLRNHPNWGANVARNINLSGKIVDIISYHHERYDGRGYPFGIQGNEIPLETRIVTMADVYDALTSDRPYRRKYSEHEALNIMMSMKGKILDPELLDLFLHDCLGTRKEQIIYEINNSYNNPDKFVDLIPDGQGQPVMSDEMQKTVF